MGVEKIAKRNLIILNGWDTQLGKNELFLLKYSRDDCIR